ncbi:MAG: hypothetical protein JWN48_633 [Myxococcaceae bacterium]|nr:hypothetical protein [Myxococcaceae bacterium]
MQGNLSHSGHTYSSLVSLGENHGYRFEGDTAILNAELAIAPSAHEDGLDTQRWALQLWACETPYQGGPLRGLKIAEAELALPALPSLTFAGEHEHTRLETAAFAHLPPAQGEYNMVLVLASGDRGRYDQVHDFSNYAERQQFAGPRLEGNVGYRVEGEHVVLQADAVRNTRALDNLSGSLTLQLWALSEPYDGGLLYGTLMAQAGLGRLEGQSEERFIERSVPLTEAPVGSWQLALVLTEWTDAAGYLTRDFCNFAAPHVVAPSEPSWFERQFANTADEPELEAPPEQAWAPAPEREPSSPARGAELQTRVEADREAQQTASQQHNGEPPAVREIAFVRVAHVEAPVAEESAATLEAAAAPAVVAQVAGTPAQVAVAPETRAAAAAPTQTVQAPAAKATPAVAEPLAAPKAVAQAGAEKPAASARSAEAVQSKPAAQGVSTPVVKAAAAQQPAVTASSTRRVSVQTASVDELASVEGLNKKLAQAIVKARPFHTLEDVVKVRGIGDKMLQRLRDQLTL